MIGGLFNYINLVEASKFYAANSGSERNQLFLGKKKMAGKKDKVVDLGRGASQAKFGVRRPSAHLKSEFAGQVRTYLKAPQTDFATCALPKCASRAQNPTFAPYLRTSFSALESYSLFLWCFLLPVSLDSDLTIFVLPINITTVSKSI